MVFVYVSVCNMMYSKWFGRFMRGIGEEEWSGMVHFCCLMSVNECVCEKMSLEVCMISCCVVVWECKCVSVSVCGCKCVCVCRCV